MAQSPAWCENCGLWLESKKTHHVCGKCMECNYCSKACQVEDWKNHKLTCKITAKAILFEHGQCVRKEIVSSPPPIECKKHGWFSLGTLALGRMVKYKRFAWIWTRSGNIVPVTLLLDTLPKKQSVDFIYVGMVGAIVRYATYAEYVALKKALTPLVKINEVTLIDVLPEPSPDSLPEPSPDQTISAGKIKKFTGGDGVYTRSIHDDINFRLTLDNKVTFANGDDPLQQRLIVEPFESKFRDEDQPRSSENPLQITTEKIPSQTMIAIKAKQLQQAFSKL